MKGFTIFVAASFTLIAINALLEKRKIVKIEKNCQIKLEKIIRTQTSFSTKGSNCILTFHKDNFQVKLNSFATNLDLDNIKYSDISSIDYGDSLSSKNIIKIKLISNFEVTLGFVLENPFNRSEFYENYENYFLTKLFLNFKNLNI
ncbi:MAG: hypothetical protein ACRC1R_00025 [Cetobacterium sp.]|uniref:hypothetical protein n=1 Tax=Cetobacterium sp. TaxID=2071632 RepID=UPI003F2DC189